MLEADKKMKTDAQHGEMRHMCSVCVGVCINVCWGVEVMMEEASSLSRVIKPVC